ncbi:lipoma HMGIC fusion partner [Aphelenchoides avenae]|nr:lipoma HMGIC fusion partner [Aphelenchus avenae]
MLRKCRQICSLQYAVLSTGLTLLGVWWVFLSLAATASVGVGFYMPIWIVGSISLGGRKHPVYFGSFRRCNYPVFNETTGSLRMEHLCGRYSTFADIPSVYWRITTIFVAVGCFVAGVLALILIASCCFRNVVTRSSAMPVGLLQVLAAVSVSSGCVIYPLGWNSDEVRDACGDHSGPYLMGDCQVGWAYICMLSGSALLLACGGLSVFSAHSLVLSNDNRLRYRHSLDAEALVEQNLPAECRQVRRSQQDPRLRY